jgi:hypothetical protein
MKSWPPRDDHDVFLNMTHKVSLDASSHRDLLRIVPPVIAADPFHYHCQGKYPSGSERDAKLE